MWVNMSAFGINHVSVNSDMTSATLSLDGSFKDMYIFTTGLRYHYRPGRACKGLLRYQLRCCSG
jgi:hypothetical protein